MIKLAQKAFLSAIKTAILGTDPKSSMPILSDLHLRAVDGVLTVRGFDLTTDVTITLPYDGGARLLVPAIDAANDNVTALPVSQFDLDLCVNAKSLANAVKACAPLPKGRSKATSEIALSVEGHTLTVHGSTCTLKLNGRPATDFPAPVGVDSDSDPINYDRAKLINALDFTVTAASTDFTRYHLNGVCFDGEKMVATDGHRVHLQSGMPDSKSNKGILPRGSALTLMGVLKTYGGTVTVGTFTRTHAAFYIDTATVIAKLVDHQFPPYEQVIPRDPEMTLSTERTPLMTAIKSAGVMSSDRTYGIKLDVAEGSFRVEANNPDAGDAHATLTATVRTEGRRSLTIGVNGRYLLDFLGFMDAATVNVEMSGELDPIKCQSDDRLAVVMPMRI